MAVIFDEVTADVHPPSANAAQTPAQTGGTENKVDPNELRRELERQAERRARLQCD